MQDVAETFSPTHEEIVITEEDIETAKIELNTLGPDDQALAYARMKKQITNLTEENENLRKTAGIDMLTGLPNRAGFLMLFNQKVSSMLRANIESRGVSKKCLGGTVLCLDVQGLHKINDEQGYDKGDEHLRLISIFLKEVTRGSDILARWGGDEFIIFLVNTTEDQAVAILKRIQERQPSEFKFNIGVAEFFSHHMSIEQAIKISADGMEQAKKSGLRDSTGRSTECFVVTIPTGTKLPSNL